MAKMMLVNNTVFNLLLCNVPSLHQNFLEYFNIRKYIFP